MRRPHTVTGEQPLLTTTRESPHKSNKDPVQLQNDNVCSAAQSCPTLCNPVDCSPPGSSVHGISQARIPEWVPISFSRESSLPWQADSLPLSHQWSLRVMLHRHKYYTDLFSFWVMILWLSEETLQIAEKRRKVKGKRENERYTHLNAEFHRIARRDKKAFLNDQCIETQENNRMRKTRDLFKIIEIPREHFMQRWAQ